VINLIRNNLIYKWIANGFLSHSNTRTVCPPGIIEAGCLPHILLPSITRTGTHILIDFILNNFSFYKRKPLYIDLDKYVVNGGSLDFLLVNTGYIIKTHYPQRIEHKDIHLFVEKLINSSILVSPARVLEETRLSTNVFGNQNDIAEFRQAHDRFIKFWQSKPVSYFDFNELVDDNSAAEVVNRLRKVLKISPNKVIVTTLAKNKVIKVLIVKLITRLFGSVSPIVNTTIGFKIKR
jgi:hypothetical protein